MATKFALDFEYNLYEHCVFVRDKYGEIDSCRHFVDCGMCVDVDQIDVIHAHQMTR